MNQKVKETNCLDTNEYNNLKKILLKRGIFSEAMLDAQLPVFCSDTEGMGAYYFMTTPLDIAAEHFESISCAGIISESSDELGHNIEISNNKGSSAIFIAGGSLDNILSTEQKIDQQYQGYRLQSYLTQSKLNPLRVYFLNKPHPKIKTNDGEEFDIRKIIDQDFLISTMQETRTRYQQLLNASKHSEGPVIEVTDGRYGETRIMICIKQEYATNYLSQITTVTNFYKLRSRRKYIEPLANNRVIVSLYFPAIAEDIIHNLVEDLSLIHLMRRENFGPFITRASFNIRQAFFIHAASKFTHHFISDFDSEYVAITRVLRDYPEQLGALRNIRNHYIKSNYSEERIFDTVFRYPEIVKNIYGYFSRRFNPYRAKENPQELKDKAHNDIQLLVQNDIDKAILKWFLLFSDKILKTNFYFKQKMALSFRMDGSIVNKLEYPENPYAIILVLGKEFSGYHIRFRPIARGGIRIIRSNDKASYTLNHDLVFEETYNLAYTQQRKNKDIPEGGSKGALVIHYHSNDTNEQCFKQYIDSLLDLMLPRSDVRDYLDEKGKEDIIFIGPDEGTAEFMDWAGFRAKERNYQFWKAFSTGKTKENGGIRHDDYGMTTQSIHQYVLGILDKYGLKEEEVTKVQTGGPDGDLGSNEILIAKDKTIAVIDGSGVIYDPNGINREELRRLAKKRKMINEFSTEMISRTGFRVLIDETNVTLPDGSKIPNGRSFRDTFHLSNYAKADLFVPCGGRPKAVHINNWDKLLDDRGSPKFRFIVEGANVFFTQEARLRLEEKGAIIIKDASANKGGVTSSSYEVLASLVLNDEDYQNLFCQKGKKESAFRKEYIREVIHRIKQNAKREFDVLWNEKEQSHIPFSILADTIANRINDITDKIYSSNFSDDEAVVKKVLSKYVPNILRDHVKIDRIYEVLPPDYKRAIFSSYFARKFIYRFGLQGSEVDFAAYTIKFTSSNYE